MTMITPHRRRRSLPWRNPLGEPPPIDDGDTNDSENDNNDDNYDNNNDGSDARSDDDHD
jgi:hypothetical protein